MFWAVYHLEQNGCEMTISSVAHRMGAFEWHLSGCQLTPQTWGS